MNKAWFSYEKDARVTITISDEACRAYQRCEAIADHDRYEDMHCDECPLGLKIGGTPLCEIDSVVKLIAMRLTEMEKDENRTGGDAR